MIILFPGSKFYYQMIVNSSFKKSLNFRLT
jgi:hypothetical protein